MKKVFMALVVLVFFVAGCSGMRSSMTASNDEPTYIYTLSQEEGKGIMYSVLSESFPGRSFPENNGAGSVGYYATSVFALDRHSIFVSMMNVEGIGLDGKKISGYAFEVSDSGTRPITVGSKAKTIYKKILKEAAAVSQPIQATNIIRKYK